jgi:D-serine deaminase-like pyridoxal phosphate-dependent protein
MHLDLSVPTLLLDQQKCLANIDRMIQKANRHKLQLRPHFKTHQSKAVGAWFRARGVERITVSSLRMAAYFAEDGWSDITVAFPTNILELPLINHLAAKIQLNLCVENPETTSFLAQHLQHPVGLLIEINAGNDRSGLPLARGPVIDDILTIVQSSPHLEFTGFLGHAGQSYQARTKEAILESHAYSRKVMQTLRKHYQANFPDLIISLGDTPTCSVAEDFTGIDEIRPGNFVYYDLTQYYIGSCTLDQIAVAMACPVVAKAPERNELIIYGGGIHFSKDRVQGPDGLLRYGCLADWTEYGWKAVTAPGTYVKGLSQEHGVIKATTERIASAKPGDLLPILPVHSCMAADLMKELITLEGQRLSMLQYV